MLIIVEGPERSGKSVLARQLGTVLQEHGINNAELWHRGPPSGHPLDEYEVPLWSYRPGGGRHLICDRWHLGEAVYPPILGRMSKLTDAAWYHIELFLAARGAVLVKMTVDGELLRRRFTDASKHYRKSGVELRHVNMIGSIFDAVFAESLLPAVHVHNSEYDRGGLHQLVEYAEGLERQAVLTGGWFETYVGPPHPKLLLLGDVRGGTAPKLGGPSFAPYAGTSGHYLLHGLGVEVKNREIGLANACDTDNAGLLWDRLGQPETVTLGRNADICFTWPHRSAPHPQFIRRFYHQERRDYIAHILNDARREWPTKR